jgi:hypothetical protein
MDPVEIRHHRWRHKERGYVVTVLGTYIFGAPISQQYVRVDRSSETSKRERSWGVEHFLQTFKPVGRPFKPKTIWDHLD